MLIRVKESGWTRFSQYTPSRAGPILEKPVLVGYKFRGSIFKSEEKPPRRCLLGNKGLKALKHPYGISKITPYHWPSKIWKYNGKFIFFNFFKYWSKPSKIISESRFLQKYYKITVFYVWPYVLWICVQCVVFRAEELCGFPWAGELLPHSARCRCKRGEQNIINSMQNVCKHLIYS